MDVFAKLARHLDSLPAGYPETESGVELRILRKLFTPAEASLAMHMTLIAEESRVIAYRAGIPAEKAGHMLNEMDRKGLVFSIKMKGGPRRFRIQQFVIGFWEGQVDRLTPELIRDFDEYLPQFVDFELWQKMPQMRTIPIGEAIPVEKNVLPYEQVEVLVNEHEIFAVHNCICRQENHMSGHGCEKPLESCLSFGSAAERSIRLNLGREISRDEVLSILRRADEAGLVLQTSNARKAFFICTCCGCCCGVLRTVKNEPKPANRLSSPFRVSLDRDACTGDGICVERCQMDAIRIEENKAAVDMDRCIGCGLCVSACPADALTLVRKPVSEQPYVPKTTREQYIRLGQVSGRMKTADLIGMKSRSMRDRLLSPGS